MTALSLVLTVLSPPVGVLVALVIVRSGRVVVELEEQHRRQGKPFGVRIELTLPGRELVVNRVRNEDAYVALRDAFDDMKRRIEDTVRRRRDAQRQPTPEVRDEVTGDGEPS